MPEARQQCTKAKTNPRHMTLKPQDEHQALRARQQKHRMESEIREACRYWGRSCSCLGGTAGMWTDKTGSNTLRCGAQYRPTRSVARWPATCQNPELPFCRVGGLKADFDEFGNSNP
jgi:hypothetical protein